jgi:hypothetical protein
MKELVPISEIASTMGMLPTNARRYALKHGFQFVRARMSTGGGRQEVIALPRNEALRLIEFRKNQGFPPKGEADGIRLIKNGIREMTLTVGDNADTLNLNQRKT